MTEELPLFPLQTVLFPGGLLSLKVFEARYLDLAGTCLREKRPFGVVALRKGQAIGVVTAGMTDAESINFGIKIDVALHELKPLAARCECLVVVAPEGVPVLIDGVMRGTGPRVVAPVGVGTHEVVVVVKDKRRRFTLQFPEQRSVTITADAPNP